MIKSISQEVANLRCQLKTSERFIVLQYLVQLCIMEMSRIQSYLSTLHSTLYMWIGVDEQREWNW